ncbi:hypothetical protein niasHT_018712 [Heterodera trifolii]|uniref:Uncharacterized protein n=1 Tax=Heterodera trifolii TaxID=157864 RepID=A0ABD2LBD4_9BILA
MAKWAISHIGTNWHAVILCQKWRPMEPTDVDLLSKVELGGLMYWIDKLRPFPDLPANDRSVLFKQYSVRKLFSL